jgi:Protein of unknown function (DUF2586)
MTVPGATITNQDGQTGVSPQADPDGIIAVIAGASGSLPLNTPTLYNDWSTAYGDASDGPLAEYVAYIVDTAQKPVLAIRSATSQAGEYGAFDNSLMTGASRASAGGTQPLDWYDVVVQFGAGGDVGTAGITYQVSLEGGDEGTFGGITQLGASTSIVIPNTGITIDLTSASVNTGDQFSFSVSGPQVTSADLVAALEALRVTTLPYEALIIDAAADPTMIAAVDTWLAGIEAVGEYKVGVLNVRYKNIAASESEQAYAASLTALRNGSSPSTRVVVAADAGDTISPIRNIYMKRPAGLDIAARTMKIDDAVMASLIGDGPLDNCRITDDAGNPKYHDEQKYPGLDDIGYATLRSVPRKTGAFCNLPRLWSEAGSDWVFWPHARVMNDCKSIAFDVLTALCSIGVHTQPNPQNPNIKNITEVDASRFEDLVQDQYDTQIVPKRASSATFSLSRTDNLSSNGPQTLTGTIALGALRYVVKFNVNAKFV